MMLAHKERVAARSNVDCVSFETEKNVVSGSRITVDHAGETARGTNYFVNAIDADFRMQGGLRRIEIFSLPW